QLALRQKRAERTGEDLAVSGVYRGSPGGEESSPGIPRTNLPLTSTAVLDRPSDIREKTIRQNDTSCYLDYRPLLIDNQSQIEAKTEDPASLIPNDLDALLKKIDEKMRVVEGRIQA
ncbi:unnamed protein product, partial [marine sediment metagenome]